MKKLVSYITAGYLDQNFTIDLALSLKENGTDILELGIPFSDPVADGPIIEEANRLALINGFKMEQLYDITSNISSKIDTYWMGYCNMFFAKGLKQISQKAKEVGAKGFIIPDMPYEETLSHISTFRQNDLFIIQFVAPTDSSRRVKKLVSKSSGFIYLVAYAGITGFGQNENLENIISDIKKNTKTPLYLGFGINAQNAKEKAKDVDGVIVGSEYIKVLIDESLTKTQKIDKISTLSKQIKESINS